MLSRFKDFIEAHQLFSPRQKVLLALSGGKDSMVLWHLFEQSGMHVGLVHCNFQLRGTDSDRDESFVKQHALARGNRLFCRRFQTEAFARLNGISIEMAARELRYDYFEKIRAENHYDFVATAHHLDDMLETFFLNLSRKTGIRGLSGIKGKTGNIIRPLLFADRREIDDYARIHSLEYREDITNNELVFQRNFIRHRIIPLFLELNPAFKKNMKGTIENLRQTEEVYYAAIRSTSRKVMTEQDTDKMIKISDLLESGFPEVVLFEILSEYHFNPAVIRQIFQGLSAGPGKQYFSKSHRLVRDRDYLFISPLPDRENPVYYIEAGDMELFIPFDLTIEKISKEKFRMIKDPRVACLDYGKLEFPLLIRKWRQGDYFQPLGMTGFKKLSDFFVDEKIPLHEKEKIWLLCSGQKIVWIMGYRIDNRFKITPGTEQILKIEIKHS